MEKNFLQALREYHAIVVGISMEYPIEMLTVENIRNDHTELDFMDNEDIELLIENVFNHINK